MFQNATITLPPGLQLPAGTVLMKNEQGQIVFVSGQQGALQQPNSTIQPGPQATYKIQTVRVGDSLPCMLGVGMQS